MDQHQIDWQAVHVLAKQAALRAVKRQIQKEGRLRVSLILAGKLDAWAKLYLKAHPELFREALASPIVQQSPVSVATSAAMETRATRTKNITAIKTPQRHATAEFCAGHAEYVAQHP